MFQGVWIFCNIQKSSNDLCVDMPYMRFYNFLLLLKGRELQLKEYLEGEFATSPVIEKRFLPNGQFSAFFNDFEIFNGPFLIIGTSGHFFSFQQVEIFFH